MSLAAEFKKDTAKMAGVGSELPTPKWWLSTGNHIIDANISGKYRGGGLPQGRLSCWSGPSGAGKSFAISNCIKSAQDQEFGIFILDGEYALDEGYLSAVGVDINAPEFIYKSTATIANATKLLQMFFKMLAKDTSGRKWLVVVDSLDVLQVDSEADKFDKKGELSTDHGLHAKKIKQMLVQFMHTVSSLPVHVTCTKQVYLTQDAQAAMNPATRYVFTESAMFPFSQVIEVSRLMRRDKDTKDYNGINLRVFGKKTRFCKPFQTARVEVPYDTGMSKYSGLLDVAKDAGIVTMKGTWYHYEGQNFREADFEEKFAEAVLDELDARKVVQALNLDEEFEEQNESTDDEKLSPRAKRAKALAKARDEEFSESDDS